MSRARISNRKQLRLELLEDRSTPATLTWVGDISGEWFDVDIDLGNGTIDTNWSGNVLPQNGDHLIFDSVGAARLVNTNDFPNLTVASITVGRNGYVIGGNPLKINSAAGITYANPNAGNVLEINLDIELVVDQTWTMTSAGGPSGHLRMSGAVTGAGGLTTAAPNGIEFSGGSANTYAGTTTVAAGVLLLEKSSGNAIPDHLTISGSVRLDRDNQIADFAQVTINDGGSLDLAGQTDMIGSLSGSGTVDLVESDRNGTLAVGFNNLSTTFSGVIAGNGVPNFPDVLRKIGTGTLTLTGDNPYSGRTRVDDGTLIVRGAQPNSLHRVTGSATLGGDGTVGDLEVAQGILSPGNGPGPGILTADGNVAFGAVGTFAVDLSGPSPGAGYDQLRALGTVDIVGSTLEITPGFTASIGAKFTIIDNDGLDPVTGAFFLWPEGKITAVAGQLFHITYQGGDGNDVVLTRTGNIIVTGPDAGVAPRVRIFEASSSQQLISFLAYPRAFKGGVRVASADLNRDGLPDVVTAPGPGTPAVVKVFAVASGQAPQLLYQFKPFAKFKGGAYVGVGGDVNGDDVADIIVGRGAGLASLVKIHSGANGAALGSFAPFGNFKGGVTVAAGDVNGDDQLDIIAGMGPGGKPRVRSFDAANRTQLPGPVGDFLAYGARFKEGVFVAAVNLGTETVVLTGPGKGTTPIVKVFQLGQQQRSLRAYSAAMKNGVRVAGGDVNGDSIFEIVTALGAGAKPQVRLFDAVSLTAIDSFFAEAGSFRRGLFIAGSNLLH